MTTSDSSTRRPRNRRSAAHGAAGAVGALLALAVALTACGSDSDSGSADDAKASASASPSRPAEPPSPSPTKPSASPSPTAVKPMKPSSAGELAECTDGSCTVVVKKGTEIPAAPELRAGPFLVTAVGPEGVDLTSSSASGFTSSLLGQLPDQGGPSTVNELSVAVLSIAKDTAKLRLFPAE